MKRNTFWSAMSKTLAVMTVALIVIVVLSPGAAASKYKVLYRFTGGGDGSQPDAGVIFDTSGNLYGTTFWGGDNGDGTVFKLTLNGDGTWTETVLHSFGGSGDGANPTANVVFDAVGNLYGVTWVGGTYGLGTVFQLTPNSDGSWSENLLHSFTGSGDGDIPNTSLIFDTLGNLYGTALHGARAGCDNNESHGGCGTVFEMTPNSDGTWTFNAIYSFKGGRDGGGPDHGALVFDAAGNLYGTTVKYGILNCAWDCGTVFELTPTSSGGWTEKVLLRFRGSNGLRPEGTLVFDGAGSLYGTTSQGGRHGQGNVFKLTPASGGKWSQQIIHDFTGGKDGGASNGGVVFDAAGNLYGTTSGGGAHGYGTAFKLIPQSNGKWTEQVLHQFLGFGANPGGVVVFDAVGNIYGTASNDSTGGPGLVYEIIP